MLSVCVANYKPRDTSPLKKQFFSRIFFARLKVYCAISHVAVRQYIRWNAQTATRFISPLGTFGTLLRPAGASSLIFIQSVAQHVCRAWKIISSCGCNSAKRKPRKTKICEYPWQSISIFAIWSTIKQYTHTHTHIYCSICYDFSSKTSKI